MSFPATAASFITPKTSKLRAATRLYECVKLYFPARGPYRNVESSVSVDMLSHFVFPFSQAHGIFTDPWMLDFYCELVGGIYRNIPWILWEGERFLSCFFPISHPIPSQKTSKKNQGSPYGRVTDPNFQKSIATRKPVPRWKKRSKTPTVSALRFTA